MQKLSRSDQARVNGAKSKGPKTRAGKAVSSMNAFKHGRYAKNAAVLKGEDAAAFEELVQAYVRRICPHDPAEYTYIRELATIDHLLARIRVIETAIIDHQLSTRAPALAAAGHSLSFPEDLALTVQSLIDGSRLLPYLSSRESRLIYARSLALATLRRLREGYPTPDPARQVIPPQPLNPDFDPVNEPETNPLPNAA